MLKSAVKTPSNNKKSRMLMLLLFKPSSLMKRDEILFFKYTKVFSGSKFANMAAPTRIPTLKERITLRVTIANSNASKGGSIDQIEDE